MKYHYEYGATRWFRWGGLGDVRGHRPQAGWVAYADLRDYHPITDRALPEAQWWVRETFKGV